MSFGPLKAPRYEADWKKELIVVGLKAAGAGASGEKVGEATTGPLVAAKTRVPLALLSLLGAAVSSASCSSAVIVMPAAPPPVPANAAAVIGGAGDGGGGGGGGGAGGLITTLPAPGDAISAAPSHAPSARRATLDSMTWVKRLNEAI